MQAAIFKKSTNIYSTERRIFPVKYVHYFKFSPFWNLYYTVEVLSLLLVKTGLISIACDGH